MFYQLETLDFRKHTWNFPAGSRKVPHQECFEQQLAQYGTAWKWEHHAGWGTSTSTGRGSTSHRTVTTNQVDRKLGHHWVPYHVTNDNVTVLNVDIWLVTVRMVVSIRQKNTPGHWLYTQKSRNTFYGAYKVQTTLLWCYNVHRMCATVWRSKYSWWGTFLEPGDKFHVYF